MCKTSAIVEERGIDNSTLPPIIKDTILDALLIINNLNLTAIAQTLIRGLLYYIIPVIS